MALLGGSLGGFWVLSAAARRPNIRACVALATPYSLSMPRAAIPRNTGSVPFLFHEFARVFGSTDVEMLLDLGSQLSLNGQLSAIECPLFLGHGTQDRTVPFSDLWEISQRTQTLDPTIHAYVGADHEVKDPGADHWPPILDWLQDRLLSAD
jgi:pimeloyl-ACP methyl ester carboxylesterase